MNLVPTIGAFDSAGSYGGAETSWNIDIPDHAEGAAIIVVNIAHVPLGPVQNFTPELITPAGWTLYHEEIFTLAGGQTALGSIYYRYGDGTGTYTLEDGQPELVEANGNTVVFANVTRVVEDAQLPPLAFNSELFEAESIVLFASLPDVPPCMILGGGGWDTPAADVNTSMTGDDSRGEDYTQTFLGYYTDHTSYGTTSSVLGAATSDGSSGDGFKFTMALAYKEPTAPVFVGSKTSVSSAIGNIDLRIPAHRINDIMIAIIGLHDSGVSNTGVTMQPDGWVRVITDDLNLSWRKRISVYIKEAPTTETATTTEYFDMDDALAADVQIAAVAAVYRYAHLIPPELNYTNHSPSTTSCTCPSIPLRYPNTKVVRLNLYNHTDTYLASTYKAALQNAILRDYQDSADAGSTDFYLGIADYTHPLVGDSGIETFQSTSVAACIGATIAFEFRPYGQFPQYIAGNGVLSGAGKSGGVLPIPPHNENDVLIMVIASSLSVLNSYDPVPDIITPPGWDLVHYQYIDAASPVYLGVYMRAGDGVVSEVEFYSKKSSLKSEDFGMGGSVVVIRDVKAELHSDVAFELRDDFSALPEDGTCTAPSVTTTVENCIIIHVWGSDSLYGISVDDNTLGLLYTFPSIYASIAVAGGNRAAWYIGYTTQPFIGPSVPKTLQLRESGEESVGISFALEYQPKKPPTPYVR